MIFLFTIILSFTLFGHTNHDPLINIVHPGHEQNDSWTPLQSSDSNGIQIKWMHANGIDWVRSTHTVSYDINKVSKMIEDKSNYYNIFDRVVMSREIGNDAVHIRLDMPFPISDRDYIVKYTENKTDKLMSYKFFAVDDLGVDELDGSIRLINAAGEWHLEETGNFTKIIYTWNGELRGDFPDFALTRAWTTQGNEIINWLAESLAELYGE